MQGEQSKYSLIPSKKRELFHTDIWIKGVFKDCAAQASLHLGLTRQHEWEKCVGESASGGEREENSGRELVSNSGN